ncbi:E3 ubiquitin-protein ligase DZIP3 isoform X2 [Notamacropus eugenii]|uniref:E3 ubiquitin-protein ligase DZIP3 isoform X2 n=1 Tax=Notamacropus eugenii TaxID=9315 RepID=UPI003B6836CB
MENLTKRKTERPMKTSAHQMEKNIHEDPITSKELCELRRVLKVISAVPRGLNPHIKEFIHTALSLQAVQGDGAADNLSGVPAVPSLSLEVLITQLDMTLEKIQAANCNGHQLNMDYYLTLLFICGLALIERGTKQGYSEARSKFMKMKTEIQKREDCRNFVSLVYFGCGLLLVSQKRYNGGLLEFQKSKQEIKDNNENWYGINHIKDEDLPETFQDLLDDYIKKYENHIEKETICSFPDCERSCEADILKKSKYKGFVHLVCSKNCSVYFHKICWEKLKNINHSGKSDESFSKKLCLKKGCIGNIIKMQKCEGPGVFNVLFAILEKDEHMQSCFNKFKTLPVTEAMKIQKLNLKGRGYNPEEIFQDEILEQNASPIDSIKDMKSDPEELPAEIPKDEKSAPSESSIESIKDVQESAQVNNKSKKKKKNKTKKNKELNKEHSPNILTKDEQVEKVQELNPHLSNGPEKKNPCGLQHDPAAEKESCSPAQSDTPDFPDQGSRDKPTTKHVKSQEETREQQQQELWEARRQCADSKKQLEAMILQWQQKQVQIKEKDKIIAGLNQQVSSGNHKISKLQQEIQAKDSEIRKLKEKLASERSQWEREKNKLEAKAKKCLSKLNGETNRAITAEVWFLQSRRDFGLHQLEQTERECLLQLIRATTMASSHPESLQLKAAVESWDTIVADVRNKIAFSRTQYNEQIALVKNGYPLNCLPPVQIPPPPPSPDILVTGMAQPLQAPVLETGISEAVMGNERIKISWERIMDKLKTAFPEYSRKELTDLLRKLKDANGRSLIGLTFDEIVRRVSLMIEPKRSQNQVQGVQSTDSIPPSHPQPKPSIDQPPRSAWRPLNPQVPVAWEGTKNLGDEEEPCVICHDNLTPENLSVLACAHKFHTQCIKPWLKQQGTCPTCRLYVVLPEEFPGLPSRHIPKI